MKNNQFVPSLRKGDWFLSSRRNCGDNPRCVPRKSRYYTIPSMTSFVHVESDNNDIFRKTGGNFNMMLIWWVYDDFTQNGWENRQKHMAELRDTLYGLFSVSQYLWQVWLANQERWLSSMPGLASGFWGQWCSIDCATVTVHPLFVFYIALYL